MKRNICLGVLVCALLISIPRPGQAAFGEDIPYLIQMIRQGIQELRAAAQIYQSSMQIYSQAKMAAAFMRSPGGWKSIISNATLGVSSALGQPSTGQDLVALQQLTAGRNSAVLALHQMANDPQYQPTAQNVAALSDLHLNAINSTIQINRLQYDLNYRQQLQAYRQCDPGMDQDVDAITNWRLKQ